MGFYKVESDAVYNDLFLFEHPGRKCSAIAKLEAYSMPEPNSGCWLWFGGTIEDYGPDDEMYNDLTSSDPVEAFQTGQTISAFLDHMISRLSAIESEHEP